MVVKAVSMDNPPPAAERSHTSLQADHQLPRALGRHLCLDLNLRNVNCSMKRAVGGSLQPDLQSLPAVPIPSR